MAPLVSMLYSSFFIPLSSAASCKDDALRECPLSASTTGIPGGESSSKGPVSTVFGPFLLLELGCAAFERLIGPAFAFLSASSSTAGVSLSGFAGKLGGGALAWLDPGGRPGGGSNSEPTSGGGALVCFFNIGGFGLHAFSHTT